jgi:hypothetical protein
LYWPFVIIVYTLEWRQHVQGGGGAKTACEEGKRGCCRLFENSDAAVVFSECFFF